MAGSGVAGLFSGPEVQEDPGHAASLVSQLKQLYESQLLCDVTLRVPGGGEGSGRSFLCNRNVLAAACPYFRSMFTGGLYESQQREVTLHDVSAESMGLIIEYCYTGRVTVSEGNVQRLYAAADMLQLEYVRQACANYLLRHLELHNCANTLHFADAFHHPELRSSCLAFISRHFQELAASEELCELSLEQIKAVLAMDELDVASERTVCAAALRWLEANPQDMAEGCQELLGSVRWQLFTQEDRSYLDGVKDKTLLHTHCLRYLQSVLPAACAPTTPEESRLPPRIGMTAKQLMIFFGHQKFPYLGYEPYSCDIYIIPSPVSTVAAGKASSTALCVSPESDVYLVAQPLAQLWVYSPVRNSWQLLGKGLLSRDGMDVAYLNGYVYIVGGRDPTTGNKIKEVECYSVQRNQWELVAPVPHSFCAFELVVCNDRLYAISSRRMLCYDPTCNQWLNCPSLRQCTFKEACVFNDEIYCLCDIPTVKVYNPIRGEWRRICPIPAEGNVTNYQIVGHGSKLLLISVIAFQWKQCHISVHEYDVTNDRWIDVSTLLGLLNYDQGFIALSARLYPSCLPSGQSFITDEEDVPSESSTDWMDGISELDSESDSLSSFSEDDWPRVAAVRVPRHYVDDA
ncbi:kelch repeat and BTB domain-containing protein 7-like [Gastrophryne carolinensis]